MLSKHSRKTKMQPRKFRRYDAPLKIQFKWGYDAFKKGGKYRYIGGKKMFTELRPRFKEDMQLKEWQRGFNTAYFENLSRIKKDEHIRKGSDTVHEMEKH
tara:strand:+ start:30 stop:329 length:300 start_codon:yes stop_codon:yes gene_type:complete